MKKPQSICDINFANERQNDVSLGSLKVSHCNALHGTGSEAFFCLLLPPCPSGETRKLVKVGICVTNVGLGGLLYRKLTVPMQHFITFCTEKVGPDQ